VPGLAISSRYVPASDQAEVGGDLYEVLRWQDGVLVAIGDVQGHSLQAAAVMGELSTRCAPSPSKGTRRWPSPPCSTRS
jgi:serine phosphatase RsbU (regulator of sigma subunit)